MAMERGSPAGGPPGASVTTTHHNGPLGRMRGRTMGTARAGLPEVVVVQGLGVADYLLPAVAELSAWTRAHLLELPGFAGSGEPPHELDVPEFADCVDDWLAARGPRRVILVGHSSGTQVAARAAAGSSHVTAVVLASPTIDPAARGWGRLLLRWRLNSRREPPGLGPAHRPEWRRAGARRLLRSVRAHLADSLDDSVGRLRLPLLVIRGRQDLLSTAPWARRLSESAGKDGTYVEVDGAHTFPWLDPGSWSPPIRRLAQRLADPHPS